MPSHSRLAREHIMQYCSLCKRTFLVMSGTLIKSIVALAPSSILLFGSTVLLSKTKNVGSLLQVLGAGCLNLVILAHIAKHFIGLRLCIGDRRTALAIILI